MPVTLTVMVRQRALLSSVDGRDVLYVEVPFITKAVRIMRTDLKFDYEIEHDNRRWTTRDVQELPSA